MEWFLNEPEELARLPHYTIGEEKYPRARKKGWADLAFPVLVRPGSTMVFLLCPDPSRLKAQMVGLGRRTRDFRTLGLEGDYHSWLIGRGYLVKVCDGS